MATATWAKSPRQGLRGDLSERCALIGDAELREATRSALATLVERCPWPDPDAARAVDGRAIVGSIDRCVGIADVAEVLLGAWPGALDADTVRAGALLCRADLLVRYRPGDDGAPVLSVDGTMFAGGQLCAAAAGAAGVPDPVLHVVYYTSAEFKPRPTTGEGQLVQTAAELALGAGGRRR